MSSRDFFALLPTYFSNALCSSEADSPFLRMSFSLNVSADAGIGLPYVFTIRTHIIAIHLPTTFFTEKYHRMPSRTYSSTYNTGESSSDWRARGHVLFSFPNITRWENLTRWERLDRHQARLDRHQGLV